MAISFNIYNKESEILSSINFCISHLSAKELDVLNKTALSLCINYSETFNEWLIKSNNKDLFDVIKE